MIEETDGDLIEQDTHQKDSRGEHFIEYKHARLAQRVLENDGNADYNKMQYTEDQSDTGRYNGCFCSDRKSVV